MKLRIDHLTLAARRIETISEPFAGIGLAADYGGPHENGVTHMAQVGFADGSYLEFIAPLVAGVRSPIWEGFIAGDAGPCAWCLAIDDADTEAERLRAASLLVRGPVDRGRTRPDGMKLEWRLVFVGDHSPGAVYPFLIEDLTPRAGRVAKSCGATDAGLTGIEAVVLCVEDLDAAAAGFRSAYGLQPTTALLLPGLDAHVVGFRGEPLLLARPKGRASPLGRRLAQFGPAPCGAVLGSRDLRFTYDALGLDGEPADAPGSCVYLPGLSLGGRAYFAVVESGSVRGGRLAAAGGGK